MKPAVLMIESLTSEHEARLAEHCELLHAGRPEAAGAVEAALPRIRGVVTGGGTGLSRDWFDRLPALEIVAVNGVGTDKVDLDHAAARGVRVTTTPGVLTDDVADLAIALVLAALRRLGEGERLVRSGGWAAGGALPLGRSLRGRTLGVLGLGAIGAAIARRGEAFGMRIAYWNRSPREAPAGWRRAESPVALAAASDVLAVALAATPATEALVDGEVLAALGPEGVLVNVARGSVINEPALIAALRERRIAGAGLDVFLGEPRIDPAFLALETAFLMPHQGSATVETRRAMADIVVDRILETLAP